MKPEEKDQIYNQLSAMQAQTNEYNFSKEAMSAYLDEAQVKDAEAEVVNKLNRGIKNNLESRMEKAIGTVDGGLQSAAKEDLTALNAQVRMTQSLANAKLNREMALAKEMIREMQHTKEVQKKEPEIKVPVKENPDIKVPGSGGLSI